MQNYIWEPLLTEPKDIQSAKEQLLSIRGLQLNSQNNAGSIKDLLKNPKELNIDKNQVEKFSSALVNTLKNNKGIIIHGDYDVDGVTSTAILFESFINIGFKKDQIVPFIPNRFEHGYGFSDKSLNFISTNYSPKKYPLIILVDCGITAVKQVKKAKELGFKVIIIDHHQKQDKIPNANLIIWNPKITASALSYFICKYLEIKMLGGTKISNSVDLAALGYVCDLGDLSYYVGHTLTKKGLEEINSNKRPFISKLINKDTEVKAFDLGWVVGPKINASGRLDDPSKALDLVLGNNLQSNANELNLLNDDRKEKTNEMFEDALTGLSNKKYIGLNESHRLSIVHSSDYHEGVIGLIASKVSKSLYKPAICISWDGEVGKGSCRSVSGVDIVSLLESVSHLLENYGGHKMAAGFSIKKTNYSSFEKELIRVAKDKISQELLIPKINYDFNITPDLLNYELLEFVETLEPFGNGNPKPQFVLKNVNFDDFRLMGKDGNHLSLSVSGVSARGVYFGGGKVLDKLTSIDQYDILFEFEKNEWKGNIYPQLMVRGIKPSDF